MNDFINEWEEWKTLLDAALTKEQGWLSLCGLFWLKRGNNTLGQAPSCDFIIKSDRFPDLGASFDFDGSSVTIHIHKSAQASLSGAAVINRVLVPDTSENPDIIEFSSGVSLQLICRTNRWGIRVWDKYHTKRFAFKGRNWFPYKLDFVINGIFEKTSTTQSYPIQNAIGTLEEMVPIGQIKFSYLKNEYSLLVFDKGEAYYSVLFLDETCGKSSYPPGRYLLVKDLGDNRVQLDFNRAFNPPCAFTPYATCTYPPAENRLPFEIPAGESYQIKEEKL